MTILEQGVFQSSRDLLRLDVIDWNRLNGHWPNSAEALDSIASWLIGQAYYTRVFYDISEAPQRDDWPGWEHVGAHEPLGQMFWNAFHAYYPGKLVFSDEPDFSGYFAWPDVTQWFWGDIGKVSASTFALAIKRLNAHDLWISVLDERTQVLIEPTVSLSDLWSAQISGEPPKHEPEPDPRQGQTIHSYIQRALF